MISGNFPILISTDGKLRIVESADELPIEEEFEIKALRVVTSDMLQRHMSQETAIPQSKIEYYQGRTDAFKELVIWLKGAEKEYEKAKNVPVKSYTRKS